MKKQINLLVTLSTLLILSTSCKKNNTGGKASLHVMVYNYTTPIYEPTIYVKFGAKSQPADPKNNYDLKVLGEEGENHCHIEDLRIGEYYLYAVGYDSLRKKIVEGGIATKINWSERKKMKGIEVAIQQD